MMRLTHKNFEPYSFTLSGYEYLPIHNITKKQCINKLGQLEDIEQELENGIKRLKMLEKAWEIVKEKGVRMEILEWSKTLEEYNNFVLNSYKLTKNEYNFLKEMSAYE